MIAIACKAGAKRNARRVSAGAALALNRQEAIAAVDGMFARGAYSIAELEALMPLVSGFAYRYLEDVIGCAKSHPQEVGFILGGFRLMLKRGQA